jgi:penicillin-binding protein 1A
MPEFAYFMQKVYADKSLGIDPKAEFEKPAELNNDPIFADQNFAAIVQHGEGSDADGQGNGDAGDYSAPDNVPVESDFSKNPDKSGSQTERRVIGPVNPYAEVKKDTAKKHESKAPDRKPKEVMITTDGKKQAARPSGTKSDY